LAASLLTLTLPGAPPHSRRTTHGSAPEAAPILAALAWWRPRPGCGAVLRDPAWSDQQPPSTRKITRRFPSTTTEKMFCLVTA